MAPPPYVILPAGTAPPTGRTDGTYHYQRPPALLARSVDPLTGEILSLFTAPHPVDAAIAFQARARFLSGAALERAGTRYHEIRKLGDGVGAEIDAETKRWIKPFVERGLVHLNVARGEAVEPDMGAAFVSYRNRLTGEVERVRR
jgi:hypothetical protein